MTAHATATPAPSRLRKWLRPPRRLRFTREGKVFIFVTLLVGLAAINTGNNLLYLVLGLLLSLIVLSGILSEIALRGLEFRRKLPRRAFAGTGLLVEIEVRNTKRRLPSYSIEVEDRIADRRTDKRCYFLKVSAGAKQTAGYRRTPPARGRERYLSLRVATRFPFGLFEKWREIDLPDEQLVYPSPVRTRKPPAPGVARGDEVPRAGRGSGDVDGVRDVRPGEPVRDVHWAKTASAGHVVARERQREGLRKIHLQLANDLDAERDRAASERLEAEFGRVAFIALDALYQGTAVELTVKDGGSGTTDVFSVLPSTAAADRTLAYLARLPPDAPLPEATEPR